MPNDYTNDSADLVHATNEIFPPSSSNNGEAVPRIERIQIGYIPSKTAEYIADYAWIMHYGKYAVVLGTTKKIIESYRVYAIAHHNRVAPISSESIKLTVCTPCDRVIESTWKQFFSGCSQVAFLADKDIIHLYCNTRVPVVTYQLRNAELIGHSNLKNCCAKEMYGKTTIAMDGDLNLGQDITGQADRMILDRERAIGTISEANKSLSKTYENKTVNNGVNLLEEINPLGTVASETLESMNRFFSNLPVEQLKNTPECIKLYSDHCKETGLANHTDETAPEPDLLHLGEDVVDSGEHEMAIDKIIGAWGGHEHDT